GLGHHFQLAQMTLNLFDKAYEQVPPWDIGRPQHEVQRLAEDGQIKGSVLDIGCGTGENALYLDGLDHQVVGIDASPAAIAKAKQKLEHRGGKAVFLTADALKIDRLGRTFDTVIDSGLFHIFSDEERPVFARSLLKTLRIGGTYYLLCFSELEPADWGGPRRVTQAEIRRTFVDGWKILGIRRAVFETNFHRDGGLAWLASI